MSDFDISQQPSLTTSQPASGTYGEKAADARLASALPKAPQSPIQTPPGSIGQPIPPAPPGQSPVLPGAGSSGPGAGPLPAGLFAPTGQPGTPVSTPLAGPPPNPAAMAQNGQQQRMAQLQALAASPDVSQDTKDWANLVIRHLVQASKQ